MDTKITFKWITFFGGLEGYGNMYTHNKVTIHTIHTKIDLKRLARIAKHIEEFESIKTASVDYYKHVFTSGLTEPIILTASFNTDVYGNKRIITSTGPTVQWFLDSIEVLNTDDPDKVVYVDSMAIQFISHQKSTCIAIMNTKDMKIFLQNVENEQIEWLGDKTFDEFLAPYGYTNEVVNKDITIMLMMYQSAKQLEFKDPKEVIAHFCSKELLADLTLKGVFKDIKEHYY